jgi:hypothetical protein
VVRVARDRRFATVVRDDDMIDHGAWRSARTDEIDDGQ